MSMAIDIDFHRSMSNSAGNRCDVRADGSRSRQDNPAWRLRCGSGQLHGGQVATHTMYRDAGGRNVNLRSHHVGPVRIMMDDRGRGRRQVLTRTSGVESADWSPRPTGQREECPR
ncbi:hypothetical protein RRF57_011792 [Xylaria bambusicola]|uniref:Uncharacterized protein n=1 Tax=Xylaria bambusicola TaxID=326684 RepID=A0AAN7Z409_9PEZI